MNKTANLIIEKLMPVTAEILDLFEKHNLSRGEGLAVLFGLLSDKCCEYEISNEDALRYLEECLYPKQKTESNVANSEAQSVREEFKDMDDSTATEWLNTQI